jgi:hypothetical protein
MVKGAYILRSLRSLRLFFLRLLFCFLRFLRSFAADSKHQGESAKQHEIRILFSWMFSFSRVVYSCHQSCSVEKRAFPGTEYRNYKKRHRKNETV